MNPTVEEIVPNVVLVRFPNQDVLAKTLLRFQEHYDSIRFRGKVFTHEEFREWYVKDVGAFSYHEDWSGFNLPSSALEPFLTGAFDPLTPEEQAFLSLFRGRKEPFYIIATATGDITLMKHELAHAFFALDPDYREEVLRILHTIDRTQLEAYLEDESYHPDVWEDEMHAYLLAHPDLLAEDMTIEPFLQARDQLLRLFESKMEELQITPLLQEA